MSDKISTHARVTLTIEFSVGSSWGEKCSIEQVHKQAVDEAYGFIENTVKSKIPEARHKIRIVGKPKIEAIIVRSEP